MSGLVVDVVLVVFEEGLAGFPGCLVTEEDKFIVHLYGGNEDGILEVIAEISQNALQSILGVVEFVAILCNIIYFFGNIGEQESGQLTLDLLISFFLLSLFHLEGQDIAVFVAVHVGIGIIDQCLLNELRDLHFFLGEHVYHVSYELAVKLCNQSKISIFSLDEILHLQVFIFSQEWIGRSYPFRNEFAISFLDLVEKPTFYHIFHLQLNSVNHPYDFFFDISFSLFSFLFD